MNVGLVLRINEGDGTLSPTGEIGTAGSAGLGQKTVCVVNLTPGIPTGVVIQSIYANCGFPLPFARYVVDWGTKAVNVF